MPKSLKKVIPIDQKNLARLLKNVGDMALKRRIVYMVHNLDVREGDKVLDCGCGEGFHLVVLNELFKKAKFYGLDYDKKLLQKAKEANKKDVELVKGNIYKMPFKTGFFDKIVLSEVLEHLDGDKDALTEVARILKKNGILIITVPNQNYPFLWDPVNRSLEEIMGLHVKKGFFAGIWNMHLRLYEVEQLTRLAKSCKLKVEDKKALTHYCLPFNHIVLYSMRKLLEKGALPKKMMSTVDKFEFQKRKKKGVIDFVYKVINFIDKFNDNIPHTKSSVAIALKVRK